MTGNGHEYGGNYVDAYTVDRGHLVIIPASGVLGRPVYCCHIFTEVLNWVEEQTGCKPELMSIDKK